MVETIELSPELGFVQAEVNCIVDDGIPPVRYLDWPEEAHKAHVPTYEAHRVQIHNGRTADEEFTLPTHGFQLVNHHTAVKDFFDEDEIRRVYYPEAGHLQYRSGQPATRRHPC